MKNNLLSLAISIGLFGLPGATLNAGTVDGILELSDLNGSNGLVINGADANDRSGFAVSTVGDINSDGFSDLLIGAPSADPNGGNSGSSYVIFGAANIRAHPLELSNLEQGGTLGIVINGVSANNRLGYSVSAAGDINGDGLDDMLIGAPFAEPSGTFSGTSYVIFGTTTGLPNPLELSSLNGQNGFAINGLANEGFSGSEVSAAGDINNDGLDDILIGAPFSDANGNLRPGSSHVIFGSESNLPNPLELSNLNGQNGFVIHGASAFNNSGRSVSAAGDINGDGLDDILIGADGASPNGSDSGAGYVVFGSSNGLPNPLQLSSLNGQDGIVLNGAAESDYTGFATSGAGDINGDGVDDLLLGAFAADPNGNIYSGISYLVFGSTDGLPSPLELSSLNGLNGIIINGMATSDAAGRAVSAAGDVNGDGLDDLLIGAYGASPNNNTLAGASYVIFGTSDGLPSPLQLGNLDGLNGFVLNGVADIDNAGSAVSAAGDVNGDGLDDLLIGAPNADVNGNMSGSSYLVFGEASLDVAVRKTSSMGFANSLFPVSYTINVVNLSMIGVNGIQVVDNLPSTLDITTASWSCDASGGAVCPNNSGSGNINEIINLPSLAEISYTLTANVLASEGQSIINIATVNMLNGLIDRDTNNNRSINTVPVALFADSFENN